jgi:hypothetical protein
MLHSPAAQPPNQCTPVLRACNAHDLTSLCLLSVGSKCQKRVLSALAVCSRRSNSLTLIWPISPSSYVRTLTTPASMSLWPTTQTTGILSSSAFRMLLPNFSPMACIDNKNQMNDWKPQTIQQAR